MMKSISYVFFSLLFLKPLGRILGQSLIETRYFSYYPINELELTNSFMVGNGRHEGILRALV